METQRILALQTVDDLSSDARRRFRSQDDRLIGYEIVDLYALDYVADERGESRLDVPGMLEDLSTKVLELQPDALLIHRGLAFDEYTEDIITVLGELARRFPHLRIALQDLERELGQAFRPSKGDHERFVNPLPGFFDQSAELQIMCFRVFRPGQVD
jgi:hypothetical protein